MDITGKVALVTGVTSGIGKETARVLGLRGAHVILASRNLKKLNDTKTALEESLASSGKLGKFSVLQLDLGDLDSVRSAAAKFQAMNLGLDLLVNNAGIMALPQRTPTKQNFEAQVGRCCGAGCNTRFCDLTAAVVVVVVLAVVIVMVIAVVVVVVIVVVVVVVIVVVVVEFYSPSY